MNILSIGFRAILILMTISGCKNDDMKIGNGDSAVKAEEAIQAPMPPAPPAVGPSKDSCIYYLAQEEKRQCVNRAGDGSNYLTHFGYNYCNLFLYGGLEKRSEKLANFLVNVRFCLQKRLSEFRENGSCSEMDRFATDSHLSCYIEANFCDVSFMDQVMVAKAIASFDIIPRIAESAELFAKIQKSCNSYRLLVVSRALQELADRSDSLSPRDMKNLSEIFAKIPGDDESVSEFFGGFLRSIGVRTPQAETTSTGTAYLADVGPRLTDDEFRAGIARFLKSL